MKKPYISKYKEAAGFSVWIVDGEFIRTNIDEEFTNFGQHLHFDFIPEKEFWIDKEYGGDNEEEFYIDHMLVETRLMKEGKSYDEAIEKADKLEKKERMNALIVAEKKEKKLHKQEIIEKIHKELWKKYSNDKIKIWIVRGDLVRDFFFIDFTEGGHDKVYSFVPHNEVWIDDDVNPEERLFVLLHEVHERNLMVKGMPYYIDDKNQESAHRSASEIEYFCRRNPEKLKDNLMKEIEGA